ncbi:MAG: heavy metal-binding domain-containing protein [Acidobacteriota bacterium]
MRGLLLSVLIAAALGPQAVPTSTPQAPAESAQAAAYMCPVHPDVMSAIPGKCPRDGTELVPAPTSAYVCPMHPDVMSATAGRCPRCNMDLVPGSPLAMPDYRLRVDMTPRVLKVGQPATFRFTVHHPLTGAQAREFALMHDKLYHLFVVSRDLQEFAHVHPEPQPDGSFTIQHTLPKPGHYVLYSDFLAMGGGAQVVTTPLVTEGVDSDIVASITRLKPDLPWIRTTDNVRVELVNEPGQFQGGEEIDLIFRFSNAVTNEPITDLQRYLGAWGHLLILNEDMTEYVHAHPREETQPDPYAPSSGGPEIIFDALLPRPDRYRAWLQFQRNDRLTTVVFTFAAPRPGETLPQ